jgi:amino acid adenylation domain-containing protein
MTDLAQRIANLSPEKRALLESRLEQESAARIRQQSLVRSGDGLLVASFGQEALWAMEQIESGTAQYNICYLVQLKGSLDVAALASALHALVTRHETFRTRYLMGSDGRLQLKLEAVPEFPFPLVDLSSAAADERDELLARAWRTEANTPIALDRELLMRAELYRLAASEHTLQLTMHHAAMDGWSQGVLFRDLSSLYNAEVAGRTAQLPDLPIAFSDYARWQRSHLAGPVSERLISYWKNQLQGSSQTLHLPTDRVRPAKQTFRGASREYSFSAALFSALREFCLRERATPFMVTLAAFYAVLACYSGQNDILVGSPIAARPRIETEDVVGLFMNTIVLRGNLDGDPTFRELLNRVRKTALDAYAHQDLPIDMLVRELAPERDPSRSVLFQVMLVYQNAPAHRLELHGLDTSARIVANDTSKVDISIELTPSGETLDAVIEFSTDLFESATIDRLWGHLTCYLQHALESPDQIAAAIPLMTQEELRQALVEWNRTESPYPREISLAELVEEQVERTPHSVAVACGERAMTYLQMNERANQLAHELLKRGVGPGQLIGVYLERSAELVVALLAIMKSGAAYLPLDLFLPSDRISFMLEDSGVQLLITEQSLRAGLPSHAGTAILIDDRSWLNNSRVNIESQAGPEDLAYLIYTSGSTGKPKGVEIPRGALTNFLWSIRDRLQLSQSDRLLAVTTISFDIAGLEIWLPLLFGAQIVVASRESAMDGVVLRKLIDRHEITCLQATPVTWRILLDAGWRGKQDMQALCGGEAMPPELADRLVPAVKRVWNLYGPTETTIWSTACVVTDGLAPVSIGRPLANTRCYILDSRKQPLPIGVTGELYIGGDGLARGYWKRPELTSEKFLADPFRAAGARIFRTGDLARYRTDGSIECLGRIDHQIKLRGYRIEPGEIEEALKEDPEIEQAVVAAREVAPRDKQLVAYLVTTSGLPIDPAQLSMRLKRSLPDYMVPQAYVFLDRMPLSANGKIDRNALRDRTDARTAPAPSDVAARNPVEETLARIWAEVLEVPRVGIHDDFFAMGGHSLRAVQLIFKIRNAFPECQPSLATILKAPTVEQFARTLGEDQAGSSCLVAVREGNGRPPLFCVPGAGGNLLSVHDLAMALPADQPFYCLQDRGLDARLAPFSSVEEAAECYVSEIVRVQPHGPYHLAGACYGGLVVFEMAQRLRALGESVGMVALIDTRNLTFGRFLPITTLLYVNMRFFLRRTLHHLKEMARIKHGERGRYFRVRSKILLRYMANMALFAVRKQAAWIPTGDLPIEDEALEGQMDPGGVQNRVGTACVLSSSRYFPKPYDGHLLVFRAERRLDNPYRDEALGWRPLARGGVSAFSIDADHNSMFRQPEVARLAEILDSALMEVWRASQAAGEPK